MNRPKQQRPVEGPSEDMQYIIFLVFFVAMISLLGACGALHG